MVGTFLLFLESISGWLGPQKKSSPPRELDTALDLAPRVQKGEERVPESIPNKQASFLADKLRYCLPVGLAIGSKYAIGHWTLQVTPTNIYELFHCLNILYVAILAHICLDERLKTWREIGGCAGVIFGSALAVRDSFQQPQHSDNSDKENEEDGISWLALSLNITNGALAGVVVVLLRFALLKYPACTHGWRVIQVTAFKMLVGGVFLSPFAFAVERDSIFALSWRQALWFLISSAAILLYHVNLGLLCYLLTAPDVGVVEALRPVPAFVLLTMIREKQKTMPPKTPAFWIGSTIILISAVGFHWSKKTHGGHRFFDIKSYEDKGIHQMISERPESAKSQRTQILKGTSSSTPSVADHEPETELQTESTRLI